MHWWLMYSNGKYTGLKILDEVSNRINQLYGSKIIWMKCNDIARYYTVAKTCIINRLTENGRLNIFVESPFACKNLTLSFSYNKVKEIKIIPENKEDKKIPLKKLEPTDTLLPNTWFQENNKVFVCFYIEENTRIEIN